MSDEALKNIFNFSSPMQLGASEEKDKQRSFSGVAYTGDVITDHWYWDSVVFDLSSITMPDACAALIDHDLGKRAGVITQHSIDDATGLSVFGKLLSNENGKAVAQDSDDGFPWQMSVRIEPSRVEELKAGATAFVNGRQITGPANIFRDSKIIEVSFTAAGWDSKTSAVALSRTISNEGGSQNMGSQLEDKVAELTKANEELTTKFSAATDALNKANAQIAQFSKAARLNDIKEMFAKIGKEFKDDDAQVLAFAALPDEAYTASASLLLSAAAPVNAAPASSALAGLFSHVATAETAKPVVKNSAGELLLQNAKAMAEQYNKQLNRL